MKALAVKKGVKGIHSVSRNEPAPLEKDVAAEVLRVGICGTDRGQINGENILTPPGSEELVIGHEMIGRVVDTGKKVEKFKAGDYVIFTVRRGCGECRPCKLNRSDMCYTGKYKERGIKELDGYQCEFVADHEENIIKIDSSLQNTGVLIEPMSVVEKAIEESLNIQTLRIPGYKKEEWLVNSKVMVAGIGAVGLLAAFILSLKGAKVYGYDIVAGNTLRPSLLKQTGGKYINGKELNPSDIDEVINEMDFIFEATGYSKAGFELTDALGRNGVYVMTGIPEGEKEIRIDGDSLMRQLVLKNQVILGSVNASYKNFNDAARDLKAINKKWNSAIKSMITSVVPADKPWSAFEKRTADEIKTVVEWKSE